MAGVTYSGNVGGVNPGGKNPAAPGLPFFGLQSDGSMRCHWGMSSPLVAVIMGSTSDWDTMRHAVEMLNALGVPSEHRVVSAHRTPALMAEFAAEAAGRGIKVIIAGAGGAAHLPGMVAAQTWLPVFGVPVQSKALNGMDSLLSIVQMPGGIPVGTLAIGAAGAKNAAILAASVIALEDETVRAKLIAFREKQTADVLAATLPEQP